MSRAEFKSLYYSLINTCQCQPFTKRGIKVSSECGKQLLQTVKDVYIVRKCFRKQYTQLINFSLMDEVQRIWFK